jgi:hypothetical protein
VIPFFESYGNSAREEKFPFAGAGPAAPQGAQLQA